MLRRLGWRVAWTPYLTARGLRPYWREITYFESGDESQKKTTLAERLLAQVRYFGRREDGLPDWRYAANAASAAELWDRWTELPILTKRDLQERFHPDRMKPFLKSGGTTSSTGGSTGEPTPFHHDAPMLLAKWTAVLYSRWRIGWRPGIPLIILWGSERDIGKSKTLLGRAKDFIQNNHLVDGYTLDDDTVDRVVTLISQKRKVAMYGFTSMLEFVAQRVVERGLEIPGGSVVAAWNGGEMLNEAQSRVFEEAFGVPLLNNYGGRELSIMAFQPAAGDNLQVLRPFLFVEVVDDEGKPCPPGVIGRLIWSSTVCRGTPFLRYDVGDLGTYGSDCVSESGIHSLSELHGRSAGVLRLPDGRILSCLFWNHLFKDYPTVRQFQVVLKTGKPVDIRLTGEGFSEEMENRLMNVLNPLFGPRGVVVTWVEEIPRSREGKLLQVVRE